MSVVEADLVISNQKGLHARAAAAFVKCITTFNSEVTVEKDGQEVDGCSILSLMMLAASKGSVALFAAEGSFAVDGVEVPRRTSVLASSGDGLLLSGEAQVFVTTYPK